MPVTKPDVDADQLRAACDDLVDEIVNGDDSRWEAYAAQMAREAADGVRMGLFRVWSANNRFYLMSQARSRGTHTHGLYAGVDQWRKRGRSVREGEQPFVIYGPPTYVRRAQGNQQQNPPAAQQIQPQPNGAPNAAANAPVAGQVMFRRPPILSVFDYSQTVADDPDFIEPDWSVPLAGGDFDTLVQLANTSPVPVAFKDIASKKENGWLDATGITVDATLPVTNQISVLAHELAHHHLGHLDKIADTKRRARTIADLHEVDTLRAVCEQEAALAQFFVMKMLGLDESVGADITQDAGAYLRTWRKANAAGELIEIAGHKGRRKLVRERFDAAYRAAQAILVAFAQEQPAAAAA